MRNLISIFAFILTTVSYSYAQTNPATVIITAGQSNADGRVPRADLPSRYVYNNCKWSYNSGANTTNGIFSTFSPKTYQTKQTDCWAFDAVTYYKLDSIATQPFYIIKETVGGVAIDISATSKYNFYWSADPAWLSTNISTITGGYSLLKALTQSIDACIANTLDTIKAGYDFKAILWHQGESDQTSTVAIENYCDNLREVVAYMRNYLVTKTGNFKYENIPFICGTISKNSSSYNVTIENSLYQLAKEDENFYVIDMSTSALQNDNLHFTAASATYLGSAMFAKLCTLGLIDTSINEIQADRYKDNNFYNIQGMKSIPTKGIFIHQRKKVIFK